MSHPGVNFCFVAMFTRKQAFGAAKTADTFPHIAGGSTKP